MSVRRLAEVQPASFEFTPENKAWAEKEVAKYPPGRQASAIIALLWRAQAQNDNWLPRAAIEKVADMLDMPKIRALEVATFYTMFNLEPVGKHYVQLCGTTPCMLAGADEIRNVCKKKIGMRATSAPTASSPGSRSSASAPAATRLWSRSTTIIMRTLPQRISPNCSTISRRGAR